VSDEPTGREFDARVMVKVMGIVWDEGKCRVCGWPFSDDHCHPNDCSMRPVPATRADDPPHYSTDAAADLSVHRVACALDGLKKRRYFAALNAILIGLYADRDDLKSLHHGKIGNMEFYRVGDYARAALRVVEGER
jgi:hypothetical protein